jgi:hypothetical protein
MTTINGFDIANLGMFILRGGDYDLFTFPERKPVEQNSWYEEQGAETDLSEAFFNEKKVTVSFYIRAKAGADFFLNLYSFFDLLVQNTSVELNISEFGKTFTLRYLSCPQYQHRGGMYKLAGDKSGRIEVEFSMDHPLQFLDGDNKQPANGRTSPTFVSLNGMDLKDFGIVVNQCYNTVLQLPKRKQPLTISARNQTGLDVFSSDVQTFEEKRVTIDCTMLAENQTQFWHNYEALFNNLRLTQPVTLSTANLDSEPCYYVSMQNFQKLRPLSVRPIVSFSLVLALVNSDYTDGNYLITNENDYIITNDNNYITYDTD